MSVEFNEEDNFNQAYETQSAAPATGLTKWIIGKGIAKNEKSANNVMLVTMIICFALAAYFLFK